MKKKRISNNQKGAIAVTFAVLSVVLIGFGTLAVVATKSYLPSAEVCKADDAAALAGAKAYGEPYMDELATAMANENYPAGHLGAQSFSVQGAGTMTTEGAKYRAAGQATLDGGFAGLFGVDTFERNSSSTALRPVGEPGGAAVEIMLVLDQSGSMQGSIDELKVAAKSFVDYFAATQVQDRMGLISFATGVKVEFELQNNFVDGIKTAIDGITLGSNPGNWDTNMEDAIDQADDNTDRAGNATTTFTAETEAIQVLVLFTDGMPKGFRGDFTRNDITYDVVIPASGANWGEYIFPPSGQDPGVCNQEEGPYMRHKGWLHDPYTGMKYVQNYTDPPDTGVKVFAQYGDGKVYFLLTGDGLPTAQTNCKCPNGAGYQTTKWDVFDGNVWNSEYGEDEYGDSAGDYSIAGYGYSSPYCNISEWDLRNYVYDISKKMTKYHARKIKEQDILIYCIGFGTVGDFLKEDISSWDPAYPEEIYYYKAQNIGDLEAMFNRVAQKIKEGLVILSE